MQFRLTAVLALALLVAILVAPRPIEMEDLFTSDWMGLAREVGDAAIGSKFISEHVSYEESVTKEGDYWVTPSSFNAADYSWPGKKGEAPSPEVYYDFLQKGQVPLNTEIADAIGVKPAQLPHWSRLSPKERLQLFSTFKAPESWINGTSARPPLHLTLAGQMSQRNMDTISGLDDLLEAAFGDPETSYKLWNDRSEHHDWQSRFVKRYLRFILNYETLSFFEPWHEEVSAGNGYIWRITEPGAREVVADALRAVPPVRLGQRLRLSPAEPSVSQPMRLRGMYEPRAAAFDGDDLALLVKGSLAAGQLWRWCSPYYFRVYGEDRVIAEGIALAPVAEAVRTVTLRVLTSYSGEGYAVRISNATFSYSRTDAFTPDGLAEFWEVPAYLLDGLTYSVSLPNGRLKKVVSADLSVTAPGEIDVKLHYE